MPDYASDVLSHHISWDTNVLKMPQPFIRACFLHPAWLLCFCCLMFCRRISVMVSRFMHACSRLALIYLITARCDKPNHGLFWLALGLFRECEAAVVILFAAPSCLLALFPHPSLLLSPLFSFDRTHLNYSTSAAASHIYCTHMNRAQWDHGKQLQSRQTRTWLSLKID